MRLLKLLVFMTLLPSIALGQPGPGAVEAYQANHDRLNGNANIQVGNSDVANGNPVPVSDAGGSITVDATSLPLPTGAATAANQTTLNGRFPAVATSADNTANPSVSKIGSYNMLFDGTTWDRARGDSTNGALVNLGANNDVTVTSGSLTCNAGTNLNTSALALDTSVDGIEALLATIDADTSFLTTISSTNTNISSAFTAPTDPEPPLGILPLVSDTADAYALRGNTSGHAFVDVQASALPTGAATEATLATIDADTSELEETVSSIGGSTVAVKMQMSGYEDITKTARVPFCNNIAGYCLPFVQMADSSLVSPVFNVDGSVYGRVYSTNGAVGGATYGAVDSNGYVHREVRRSSVTTWINAVTYNDVTTATTSASVDTRDFRTAILYYDITRASIPTNIILQLQGSPDNSNWFNIEYSYLQDLIFDNTYVGASGIDEYVTLTDLPSYMRLQVNTNGTTATRTFTLTAYVEFTDGR